MRFSFKLPFGDTEALSGQRIEALRRRESAMERYWSQRDPIRHLRRLWRAQSARHIFHLLPGETILELGSGGLAGALAHITRGECQITVASFTSSAIPWPHQSDSEIPACLEEVRLDSLPGPLTGRQFDYVVSTSLLDLQNAPALLREVLKLLKPGGQILFFETNPWNPLFQLRRQLGRLLPFLNRGDEVSLPDRGQFYELLSELGYIGISATCYDFLYAPIPRWLMMPARNLTLVLENTPGVRRLAGAILVHAQRPPRSISRPMARMVEHESLHGAISVVVPCHNEEMNVIPLVEGLLTHYDEYIHEIILVDDNSKDRTRQVLEHMAEEEPRVRPVFRTPPNGVGLALSEGLRNADGQYVLMMDCDFLHILPELRELFDAAADGEDVVIGSRFSRASVLINYPLMKILCNRSFHICLSLLFRRRLRDLTNNLKLLKREVVDNLDLESAWFAVNAETGLKPVLMGFRVRLVPISWINRTPEMGSSSFSLLKNGIGYLRVLARLAWQTRFGTRELPRPAEKRAESATSNTAAS
jgi:dolichol-phosphate mannosyltransferase